MGKIASVCIRNNCLSVFIMGYFIKKIFEKITFFKKIPYLNYFSDIITRL
jgi:hypothetical protein